MNSLAAMCVNRILLSDYYNLIIPYKKYSTATAQGEVRILSSDGQGELFQWVNAYQSSGTTTGAEATVLAAESDRFLIITRKDSQSQKKGPLLSGPSSYTS